MKDARIRSKAPVERDDLFDTDVPAAVVCAHCGDADCAGCRNEQTRSGVVAIVPWERPGAPAMARLWATARATAFESDRFFESLPDGPIAPALRFAVVSELIASAGMALVAIAPVALVAPRWLKHLLVDDASLSLRLAVAGVCTLASILVAAHVVHGWALDLGARRSGARGAIDAGPALRALRNGVGPRRRPVRRPRGRREGGAREGVLAGLPRHGPAGPEHPGLSARMLSPRRSVRGACAAHVVRRRRGGDRPRRGRGRRGRRGAAAALTALRRDPEDEDRAAPRGGTARTARRARRPRSRRPDRPPRSATRRGASP